MNSISQKSGMLSKIYELLLCAYIIFAPIINSSNIYFLGYGIHIVIVLLLLLFTIILSFFQNLKQQNFFSFFILAVFLIEYVRCTILGQQMIRGIVLVILAYILFMRIPEWVSLKSIYLAIYISTIISMIYSIMYGVSDDNVIRTATSVDGSISVIGLIIVLFAEEDFALSMYYKVLKSISFFACIAIAAFGMSRARIFIIVVLLLVKLLQMVVAFFKKGTIKATTVLLFPIAIIIIAIVLSLPISQNLISEILQRFSYGFKSLGRNDEIAVGWQTFLQNPIFGIGFKPFMFLDYRNFNSEYSNHCMYIAILARGGILLGLAFLLNFLSVLKKVLESKNKLCVILFFTFLVLGYGNAGLFNFTICGFMIPLVLLLRKKTGNTQGDCLET